MAFVVFDLDHTLYDGDSGTRLVHWLLKRDWWRTALAYLVVPIAGPLIAWLPTRRIGISVFLWIATLGLHSEGALNRLIDQYVVENRKDLRDRLLPIAMQTLHRHVAAGDVVVVATGAPTELARKILQEITGDVLPVIGTEEAPRFGGLVARQHCHSHNKVRMIRAAGFTGIIDVAYSDSRADLPLLQAATNPVVVNPNASSIDDFVKALPAGTPIVWWGAKGRAGSGSPR